MEHGSLPPFPPAETWSQELTRLNFTKKFFDLVGRSNLDSKELRIATLEETFRAANLARVSLPVASECVVRAIYDHNPECFRIAPADRFEASPMMAYLPLTSEGAAALVDGILDPACPKLDFICRPGDQPESIYLWLMYTPRKMVAGLRLIQELETIGCGVPIFTTPAHQQSERILLTSGFQWAAELFPASPPKLMVVLATASQSRSGSHRPVVKVVRSFDELAKVLQVRSLTYISEQQCSYAEEFDGNDFCATHLLGEINGEPAGCVRIRFFGDFAKLERLAVRPDYRRSRLMWAMVRSAFDHCARKGFTKLYAHARHDLVPAWERFGAKLMPGRAPFYFSDVKFREMVLDLPPRNDAIRFGSNPMLILRPEGEWNEFGPIEQAQLVANHERRHQNEGLRQLGA